MRNLPLKLSISSHIFVSGSKSRVEVEVVVEAVVEVVLEVVLEGEVVVGEEQLCEKKQICTMCFVNQIFCYTIAVDYIHFCVN